MSSVFSASARRIEWNMFTPHNQEDEAYEKHHHCLFHPQGAEKGPVVVSPVLDTVCPQAEIALKRQGQTPVCVEIAELDSVDKVSRPGGGKEGGGRGR